ncbi:MAG: putative transrane anti-sigma factor [Bryobacterales bacterium]|nr:putative transrane anti-sigma factor [Bryobacterales bacterium]
MVTCKQFLQELNAYLDESVDPVTKQHWQDHVNECPNCFVIVDTTKKTLEVYKGVEPQTIPEDVRSRLWAALERKMAAKKQKQPQA